MVPELVVPLVAAVTIGAWTDARQRRIPNALTATAVLVALSLRLALGADEMVHGLMGAGLALAVLLPLFAMRGIGGGDVKMLSAVGAFLGPGHFLVAMLATALAGGAMAIVYATARGVILPALLSTRGLLTYVLTAGRQGEHTTLLTEGAVSVPYGVAIAAGTIFALWYGAGA